MSDTNGRILVTHGDDPAFDRDRNRVLVVEPRARRRVVWFGLLNLWCQLAQDAPSAADVAKARNRVAPTLFGFTFIRKIIEGPGFPRMPAEG